MSPSMRYHRRCPHKTTFKDNENMAARELRPWSTTDTVLAKRDRGDFSAYPVPADTPDPKGLPAQESVVSSDSPTTSAVTSASHASAEKEPTSTLAGPANLPAL